MTDSHDRISGPRPWEEQPADAADKTFADRLPVVTDPDAGEPIEAGQHDEPDTHTSALQGAAAGGLGAVATGAGYAGGIFTGSETNTGIADIPDAEEEADSGETTPGA